MTDSTTAAVVAVSRAAEALPTSVTGVYQWVAVALVVVAAALSRTLLRCYDEKTAALVERAMALKDSTEALRASTGATMLSSEVSARLSNEVQELRLAVANARLLRSDSERER